MHGGHDVTVTLGPGFGPPEVALARRLVEHLTGQQAGTITSGGQVTIFPTVPRPSALPRRVPGAGPQIPHGGTR